MHKASTIITDHWVHGNGIFVLFAPLKWTKEEDKLAEEAKDAAWHLQVIPSFIRNCILRSDIMFGFDENATTSKENLEVSMI